MDEPKQVPQEVASLAAALGAQVEDVSPQLPDGSGFAVLSMPLPENHWLTAEPVTTYYEEPPMPWRVGVGEGRWGIPRASLADDVRVASRWAIRASTMNGKENDFDPDAMVQNMIVALLGYFTPDGLSHLDEIELAGDSTSEGDE
jgi:hypothetical protein